MRHDALYVTRSADFRPTKRALTASVKLLRVTIAGPPRSTEAFLDTFAALDATAQALLVRRKEVKPIELVEAAIARLERLNPELNAVVTPMYERACETARAPMPD